MFFKRKKKEKRPTRVLYEGMVKRMDVRNGSFVWLKDHRTNEEFCAELSIMKVIIDLPNGMLSKKIETKTPAGSIKLRLKHILENLGDRETYFKFIHFNRPVHVRIAGVPGGDVDINFSEGGSEDGLRKEVEEEDGTGEE